jgi:succinyl-CoA synthetase alpha subunit
VLIQGITGREGMARSKLMRDYGTRVVAGCTPGKGGQEVLGLPVFDTVRESVARTGAYRHIGYLCACSIGESCCY